MSERKPKEEKQEMHDGKSHWRVHITIHFRIHSAWCLSHYTFITTIVTESITITSSPIPLQSNPFQFNRRSRIEIELSNHPGVHLNILNEYRVNGVWGNGCWTPSIIYISLPLASMSEGVSDWVWYVVIEWNGNIKEGLWKELVVVESRKSNNCCRLRTLICLLSRRRRELSRSSLIVESTWISFLTFLLRIWWSWWM